MNLVYIKELLLTSPNCLTSHMYDNEPSIDDPGRIFEQTVLFHTWHACDS